MAVHDDLIRAAMDPGPVIDPLRIAVLNDRCADRYRILRDEYRVPVSSSWIDDLAVEPEEYAAVWRDRVFQIAAAYALIVVLDAEDADDDIAGILVGIGAALGAGTWVCIVGDHPQLMTTGAADAFRHHANIARFPTAAAAVRAIRTRYAADADLIRKAHAIAH